MKKHLNYSFSKKFDQSKFFEKYGTKHPAPTNWILAKRLEFQKIVSEIFDACRVLSGVYTGEKTLHVNAVASDGDLKRWEDFQ